MSKAKRKRKERKVETYVNIDYAELNLMKGEMQVLDHRTNRLSKEIDFINESLADLKKKLLILLISSICVGCSILCLFGILYMIFFN
jgi:hypothetical protein